jgi:hypothetical protein
VRAVVLVVSPLVLVLVLVVVVVVLVLVVVRVRAVAAPPFAGDVNASDDALGLRGLDQRSQAVELVARLDDA